MFKRKSGITLAIQRNDPVIRPGQRLSGVVTITGGRRDEQAKSLDVKVTTCSDNDTYVDDDDSTILGETHVADAVCAADFDVPSGGELRLPFEIDLPTYVPVTTLAGNRLPNALVRLTAELSLDGARTVSDRSSIDVHCLPVHEHIADVVSSFGFPLTCALARWPEKGEVYPPSYRGGFLFGPSPNFDRIRLLHVRLFTELATTQVSVRADVAGMRDTRGVFVVPTERSTSHDVMEPMQEFLARFG